MPSNTKEYMKEYLKDKHKDSIKCDHCGGKYKLYLKCAHEKTKKHINAGNKDKENDEKIKLNEKIKELQDNYNDMKAFIRANFNK